MIERIARPILAAFGVLACGILASCASLKEDDVRRWEISHVMQPVDSAGMHGRYLNASPEISVPGFFLWAQLGGGDASRNSDIVELNVAGGEARFRLIRDGIAVDSLDRDATMMPAYARMTSFRFGGIPPLFWGVFSDETAIGVNSTGALTLMRTAGGVAFLVLLPIAGGGSPYSLIYFPTE